ncbi:Protein phosphatase 2C domain [Prochlorococcus marinus str. MIT 9515]|uniref:Protein phosphatase 2C domain n=1 Tax=Prochlorococcus marinus (strain MIT 9515) TaxID=167542 RepID=A2BTW7_PROM5|nr:Protein phosphatase 2C domain [Prochlorococcus marinus str. MIT 9515]
MPIDKNDKFVEIASSLAYYLKSFSNIKRFLDYISLILKHIFNEQLSLIIPLNEKGEIWKENIKFSGDTKNFKIDSEIKSYLKNFDFSKNFRFKEIDSLEKIFNNKFKEYVIKSHKILSRGKCRGFLYTFNYGIYDESLINERNLKFIISCLAVGLENYWLLKTKKKHENVDREISIGAEIQSQLLPDYCPIIFGVDLAAHCRPALQLGGDYYDFMSLKTNISEKRREKARWALVIGDVMGKGIPAGLLMTMLRGMLRAEVLTGLPPDRILHDLNQLAIYDLDQSHRFVTLFYSDYDPRTRKLRYANAAHNPPLLWKSSEQKIIKLDSEGFVLGLQNDAEYQCGQIQLSKNDAILYYTDGVTETSNALGERFDEERLMKSFSKLCKQSLKSKEILHKIFKILDEFTGKNRQLEDDASIVVFQLD